MNFGNKQRKLSRSVLAMFAALGCTSVLTADVLTVGAFGSGQYSTIQAAIDAANDGDTVLVSPGTYSVSGTGTVANLRGKRILLQSSHGPGWTTIGYRATSSTTGHGLVCTNNETIETVIDGFRIMLLGGAPGPGAEVDGAGMLIEHASPIIRNCSFESNHGAYGGAVHVQNGAPYFDRCTFSENKGRLGGAVSLLGSEVAFDACAFSDNTADDGGSIVLFDLSQATFSSCMFEGNDSNYDGGGVLVGGGCRGIFDSCNFTANSAGLAGGAVFGGCDLLMFENCDFYDNYAHDGGGAIGTWFTQVIAKDSRFMDNMVGEGEDGHSMLGGGAINSYASIVELVDSEFDGNSTDGFAPGDGNDGGAIRQVFGSELICRSTTFDGNTAGASGGAISSDDSIVEIEASRMSGNAALGGSGGALVARGGTVNVVDTQFLGGWAAWGHGAGAFHMNAANATYDRCLFQDGIALTTGGAVSQFDSQVSYYDCQFDGATSDEDGGAMYNRDSTVFIQDCAFSGSEAAGAGHAMYNHGGRVDILRSTFRDHVLDWAYRGYAIYNSNGAIVSSIDGSFCNNAPDHIGGDPISGMGNLFLSDCPSNFPYPNGLNFISGIDPLIMARVDSNGQVVQQFTGGIGVEARATFNQPLLPPYAHTESVGMVTGYERTNHGLKYMLSTEADLEAITLPGSFPMSCEALVYADTLVELETDRLELLDISITGLGAAPLHTQWDQRSAWVVVYRHVGTSLESVSPMIAGGLDQPWRYALPEGERYWVLTFIEVESGATHSLPGGSSGVARQFEELWEAKLSFRVLGDVDDDGVVDGADLTEVLGNWGSSDPDTDLNGDGIVDGADLTMLLGNWGGS